MSVSVIPNSVHINSSVQSFVEGATELMAVLAVTRVGRYYRTTIPREVRKILGLNSGDSVEWVLEDGKIVVRKKH